MTIIKTHQTIKTTLGIKLILLFLLNIPALLQAQNPPPNNFSIDPVTSLASWSPPDTSGSELLGYMMFIDSSTITIITDTSFNYGYFWYGSTHLAGIAAVYNTGLSDTIEEEFVSEYLIPPDSLQVDMTDMTLLLNWKHPVYSEPGQADSIPENLIGYNIYRNGDSIARVYYPASNYWEEPTGPFLNSYEYSIKAVYLLIPYGFPGQTASSGKEGPVEIEVSSCCSLPFYEDWNTGNFLQWYQVHCNQWIINNNSGNPAPTAQFLGGDLKDYFCGFESWDLGQIYGDGIVQINFDLRLDDLSGSGTESFKLFIHSPDTMYEAFHIINDGSFSWTNYSIDLTAYTLNNPDYTLYFAATGEDGSNIANWSLDNVEAWYTCPAPYELTAEKLNNHVYLSWSGPDTLIMNRAFRGYNIYRQKDQAGSWKNINAEPVELKNYTDTIDYNGTYQYYVTAVFDACESAASNMTEVYFVVGTRENKPATVLRVFPNPASEYFIVESPVEIQNLRLFDSMGKEIHSLISVNDRTRKVPLGSYPDGIYLLQITSAGQVVNQKIILRSGH